VTTNAKTTEPGAPVGGLPASTSSYATHSPLLTAFDRFASRVTRWTGSPITFCSALGVIVAWAIVGPLFGFSDAWQLVINTGTTIVTFLMVFLIQHGQNKDSVALHLKLDELLAANRQASNRMIGIEDLDEQDLQDAATFYAHLAQRAQADGQRKRAHSIDEDAGELDAARRPAHDRPARSSRRRR
jgi:low affinity Fe/Cu permease